MRRFFVASIAAFATLGAAGSALADGPSAYDDQDTWVDPEDNGYDTANDDRDLDDGYDDADDGNDDGYDGSGYVAHHPRVPRGPLVPLGSRVDAQWGSSWWDAIVMDVRAGYYLVHYLGFPANWDQWVRIEQLRPQVPILPDEDPQLRGVFMNYQPQPLGRARATRSLSYRSYGNR